jgi:glycosyltransferase involved in cell wall biosynthesis
VHSNVSVLLTPGPAAAAAGIPHIWHLREIYSGFGPLWPFYRAWQARYAQAILAISSDVAGQFPASWRSSGRVATVYDGFPAAEFAGAFIPDPRLAKASAETVNIGVLGRIKLVRKGQDVLVRAMGLLREQFPNLRCFIVGEPFQGNESHRAALQEMARALGVDRQVMFLGEVADPRTIYPGLDIVVAPATTPEPFGNVIAEAMAFRKPVVATRLGGPREIIEDGVTGRLVPPGDPSALAAALAPLVADAALRERMGRAARQRYELRFEMEPYYRRVLQVYRTLTPSLPPAGLT